ncbi:MAG: CAP domain-containing protein [Leptolyngbyaceae cyanobacterium RM1_406_9]|nr:CAP domain-containing protein [Leptolyngbyaceae cyanobacterium RM1_406_9]
MVRSTSFARVTALLVGAVGLVAIASCQEVTYEVLPQLRSTEQAEQAASPLTGQTSSPYAELEQAVHAQINQYRVEQGLSPLEFNAEISEVARQHSQAMAEGQAAFSHDGFEQRGQAIAQKIPYRTVAENLAFNQGFSDPVTQAVKGWIDSPGHHANIKGDFDMTGIGVAKNEQGEYYLTQLFVKRLLPF